MSPLITVVLALLQAAPGAYAEVETLIRVIKPTASAADQVALDHVLALFAPQVDGDVDALHAAAAA